MATYIASTTSRRPAVVHLKHEQLEVKVEMSEVNDELASRLMYDFTQGLLPGLEGDPPNCDAELLLRLIAFVATRLEETSAADVSNDRDKIVRRLWEHLQNETLKGNDVHVYAAALPEPAQRQRLLGLYISAVDLVGSPPRRGRSALLRAQDEGRTCIYGIFGGQGNSRDYFEELRQVYRTYKPLVHDLISESSELLSALSQDPQVAECFSQGFAVDEWLKNPTSTPPADYLIAAPLSFPLIGLMQLAYVKAICRCLGGDPSDFSTFFRGFAGHSQGVVVAACISTATTWAEYRAATQKAIKILFWIGTRSQQLFGDDPLPPKKITEAVEAGYGMPSPMLSVSNMPLPTLKKVVQDANRYLPKGARMYLSLVNAHSNFVVSGPRRSLSALTGALQSQAAAGDQARIPFSKRKFAPSMRYLPVSVPFHCHLLAEAIPTIERDLRHVQIDVATLRLSVNRNPDGLDLNTQESSDVVPRLIRIVTAEPVNWQDAAFPDATHIIDFGPGGASGVGTLTQRNNVGTDTRVILAGVLDSLASDIGSRAEVFDHDDISIRWGNCWSQHHGLSLVNTAAAGMVIDSKLSRLLGLPPFIIAGMTPTTTHPDMVSAAMHAGYHVELACGAFHRPEQMTAALTTLRHSMPPGRGITVNVIYVAPKALAWQIPLVRQLRSEGFPITGLTVGGGVPSPDVASAYIETLGLEHVSFKPGSVASIHQVLAIAQKHPDFPVILQWTGGRGGGHHSFEDFHAPILETYPDIRNCPNVVLVAGSGFGAADASDIHPYLTGRWAHDFGRKVLMPFDGILLGSRVMVCREAHTGHGAKAAIAAAEGTEDREWERTYSGAVGGFTSVISEMGQPIHVVATRGARFWAEMDRDVFALDKKKRAGVVEAKRAYIIKKLNEDYQKVWFASKDGEPCELEDMTYSEVLHRLVKLMFVESRRRWIHDSYRRLWMDFIVRIEERFAPPEVMTSMVVEDDGLQAPYEKLEAILSACPEARHSHLCLDDVHYLLLIFRRPSQKPVPFVPALDENFETWFKKDSLWQSEDLEAVPDRDAGRTFILQGPVAARQSTAVDQPIKDIMDSINSSSISRMLDELYGGDEMSVRKEEYIHRFINPTEGHLITEDMQLVRRHQGTGSIDVSALSGERLLALLAGRIASWRQALFASRDVAQGSRLIENPVRKMINSLDADLLEVSADAESPEHATITLFKSSKGTEPKLLVSIEKNGRRISVKPYTWDTADESPLPLTLEFEYLAEAGHAPMREISEDRNRRVYDFYRRLWLGAEDAKATAAAVADDQTPETAVFEDRMTVDEMRVRSFNNAIGRKGLRKNDQAPLHLAIAVAWKPIAAALLQSPVQGDLLKLVHLSNSFELASGADLLRVGEHLHAEASIRAIRIEDSGKIVEIACKISREDVNILTLLSRFLFRGRFDDFESTFDRKLEPDVEVTLSSPQEVAVLASKLWFQMTAENVELVDSTLLFRLETFTRYQSKGVFSGVQTTGAVFQRRSTGALDQIGTVAYNAGPSRGNPVISYLERCGDVSRKVHDLERALPLMSEESAITIPASNKAYSTASGDFNPIHTSRMFAGLVGLPGTITHGMYYSAAVSQVVLRFAADDCEQRMRKYEANFVGMVLPGDILKVSLSHTGMKEGLKVIKVEARKESSGEKVMEGIALIEQPPSTFVFTGQGSQEKSMGMDLYESSPVVRAVWDEADRYFEAQFGLRITDIVRSNPRELRVHFGGAKGRLLRQNYMNLTYDVPGAVEGTFERCHAFPDVNDATRSYCHRSPKGLLFATQFTQPALTILEIAAFKDMESRGLVDPQSSFAGHSLGEYSALAAITNFMPFERLLFIVFCRGLTMQAAVQRDEMNRSDFGMVAVDPSRIGKGTTLHLKCFFP